MSKPEPIWKIKGFESEYDYLTHLSRERERERERIQIIRT